MSNETQLPEIGAIALARYFWRQLTSMRTALVLLLLLALAAIPGSLIPQNAQNPMAVSDYFEKHRTLAIWFERFSLFDVYSSPWFSAIYILLFISLIGCVLPRSFEHLQASRALPPKTPKNLARMEHFQSWPANGNELEIAKTWLKAKRFRILESEESIAAEKGYLRETGNLFFHISLILILVGVLVGGLFGVRGSAILSQGERFVNNATSYDTISFGQITSENSLPPFTIKVDKFVAKYNTLTSAPEDYTLYVTTVAEPGATPKQQVVKVNSPLTFGSTRVYLQANGYSPIVTVQDKIGNVTFQGPVPFLPQDGNLRSIGAIKVPDGDPQLGFVASFVPTYERTSDQGAISVFPEALDPHLLFSIWQGDLGLDTGRPQSVYRIDTSNMKQIALDSLKPGEFLKFSEGTITFEDVVPWVNLQIVSDPGKSYSLIGGIVAILGLLASLFARRRRIWIRVSAGEVQVAGLAKNGAPGLEIEMSEFVAKLRGI
jgi:cytochrome c biogenesis protein